MKRETAIIVTLMLACLACISRVSAQDYQWQLKLAEAEQAEGYRLDEHLTPEVEAAQTITLEAPWLTDTPPTPIATTGTTPAPQTPARKPALVVPKVLKQAAAARRGYPVRGDWWTVSGAHLDSYAHLTTGRHANRYDTAWLKTLTRSEINSLHSDDHDNRVNWSYAVRPARAPAAKATAGRWVRQRFCTGNGCSYRWVWVAQ